jgi:hypothetical protein
MQTVQLAVMDEDGLITRVPNIYHSAETNKFTTSIHTSCAMKGSQATGKSLLASLLNPQDYMELKVEQRRLMDIHVEFTLSRINAAYLFRDLGDHHVLNDELGCQCINEVATRNVLDAWTKTLDETMNATR